MPRDPDTGIYTRVSNSFSNPVLGTAIEPMPADALFDDYDGAMNAYNGTSSTSLAIQVGSRTFTTQADKVFLPNTFVRAFSQANSANFMYGAVTSYDEDTGELILNVVVTGGSGTHADWLLVQNGVGPNGASAGFIQAFDSSTSDADPGAGEFRLNNATPGSATAAYIDNVDAFGGTVSGIIDLWDDSTNTIKGKLRFVKVGDQGVWAEFNVTGSVVDGTGYRKVTLASGAHAGTFTAVDQFAVIFIRAGDKGTDGAGTGDFSSNTATSVDAEIVLFSGTGGKTGKRATTTGILKGASGVLSAATAGTDYMKPDTTSNLSAGFTATSFSAGTKTTGTFTPDPASGNIQHYTNGGAHTLAPPSSACTMVIECTNASAGALTTSGFSIVSGDTYSSTGTKKHIFRITKTNSFSQLDIAYVTGT